MTEHFQQILTDQYDAALSMLRQCVIACPDDQWEQKLANAPVRWVAYHTLFFTDYYLSCEDDFVLRELNQIGGDERLDEPAAALDRLATLDYCDLVHEQVHTSVASETEASLRGPCGFSWMSISRAELHLYNLRHVQHHAGQLSAHLRRLGIVEPRSKQVRWIRTGWTP